ncbi:GBS Bsp-like repeat-containing protein [Enterococcus sp. 669A]|uniref:GBS Bsp-like repeat-containing protein n=1 Tax=Candidatus Enterococcus moelleringii TaxID=2815325 RepID=A0ABS3L8U6_9ENTE|nr:glycerophosphodiester phosphodiesterase family protein [Enterococcus sp. 669A]MBO1306057.1 GBS Bsp-like repeat-containing protein [Enterococcus sp. 669A]
MDKSLKSPYTAYMSKFNFLKIIRIGGSILLVLICAFVGRRVDAPVSSSEIIQDSLFSQTNFPKYASADNFKWNSQDDSWVNSQYAETLDNQFQQKNEFNSRPVFRLINSEKKQTIYHLMADLTYTSDVEEVAFVVWGAEDQSDMKKYPAVFDPAAKIWQADVPIIDHKVAGRYQVRLLMTKTDDRSDELNFGEFEVTQPTVSAKLDTTRTDKGQFDLSIQVQSAADIEKLEVPVWAKEDKSDLKVYEAQQQDPTTYKIRMDYEDFDFKNGTYHSEVFLTSKNGLSAQSEQNKAEIKLTLPKRVRVLEEATIYQNRALTEGATPLERNATVEVEGVVYNDEQKIFKTKEGYIPADNLDVSEKSENVQYVSHRGNSRVAPENSIPAFQQATTWGVESDARMTKDRQWVMMHDDTVDRMTNGTGLVSELTLAEINGLRIDHGTNVETYDQSQLVVPTLEDYLIAVQSIGKTPVIDLKPTEMTAADYDSLAYLIDYYGFAESGMVISFDYPHLQEIKQRLPNIHVQLLSDELNEQLITDVYNLGSNAGLDIRYDSIISQVELVAQAQARGLRVNAWTIPKKEWKTAKRLGVDFITAKTGPKKKA